MAAVAVSLIVAAVVVLVLVVVVGVVVGVVSVVVLVAVVAGVVVLTVPWRGGPPPCSNTAVDKNASEEVGSRPPRAGDLGVGISDPQLCGKPPEGDKCHGVGHRLKEA